jgi:hypothetical protein
MPRNLIGTASSPSGGTMPTDDEIPGPSSSSKKDDCDRLPEQRRSHANP